MYRIKKDFPLPVPPTTHMCAGLAVIEVDVSKSMPRIRDFFLRHPRYCSGTNYKLNSVSAVCEVPH